METAHVGVETAIGRETVTNVGGDAIGGMGGRSGDRGLDTDGERAIALHELLEQGGRDEQDKRSPIAEGIEYRNA